MKRLAKLCEKLGGSGKRFSKSEKAFSDFKKAKEKLDKNLTELFDVIDGLSSREIEHTSEEYEIRARKAQ